MVYELPNLMTSPLPVRPHSLVSKTLLIWQQETTSLNDPKRTAFADTNNQEFFLKVNENFGEGRDYWLGILPMKQE